ncbi:MAG: glycosyltransferase family 2 protein [Rikenellaceae bacterium MAG02]
MKISILIPTKNRLPILRDTLHNIYFVNKLPKEDFEVIVSNDGDDDLLILNDEFPFDNLKIIQNNHKAGLSGNRNNAIEFSQYEILQFLDDDILITENFLIKVLTVHKKFDNIILCGNRYYPQSLIEIAEKTAFGRYKLKYEYNWLDGLMMNEIDDGLYEVNSLAGFSISMKRETFDKVGKFDENFDYAGCEDAEFFYRASQKNVKLLFDEKNICYHNELDNFTLDSWLRRQSTGIRSAVVVCKLHPEGQNHPTWYTNTPIKASDSWNVKLLKLKKIFCSFPLVYDFIHFLAIYGEKIKLPDSFLFKFYNALWLGATYRGFREAYKEIFVNLHKK